MGELLNRHRSHWLSILLAAIGSVILALPVIGPLLRNLSQPWGSGDLIAHYIDANTWAPFGIPITTHFGFPAGLDNRYVPGIDITQNLFAWVVSTLTNSPFIGINIVFILSFPITAAFTAAALRMVGLRGPLVIVLAIALTTIPFHFDRGLAHLYLATMYAGVVGVILAIVIGTGLTNGYRRRNYLFAISALTVIAAWSGMYYAAFAIIATTAAVIWRWIHGTTFRALLRLALIPVTIAALTLLAFLPAAIHNITNPPIANFIERDAAESVIFAGNLTQLLLPYGGSVLPGLGRMTTTLNQSMEGLGAAGENTISGYGTFITSAALLTFLIGWAVLIRRRVNTQPLPFLAFLGVVTTWFFIPWGGGFLVASIISPQIRAWGRLTPILLLIVILGAGAVLARTRLGQSTTWRSPTGWIISAILLIIIVVTQVLPFRPSYQQAATKGREFNATLQNYIADVNAAIPEQCGILQLPYVAYPENGIRAPRLNDYEPAWQPLANPNKDYSYGSVKSTQADILAASMGDQPSSNQLAQLPSLGFCGIHLDKRGYTEPAWKRINTTLTRTYGLPVAEGLSGKWVLYELS